MKQHWKTFEDNLRQATQDYANNIADSLRSHGFAIKDMSVVTYIANFTAVYCGKEISVTMRPWRHQGFDWVANATVGGRCMSDSGIARMKNAVMGI